MIISTFDFTVEHNKKECEANLLTYSLAEMGSRNSVMLCCHLVWLRHKYKPFINRKGPLDEFVRILSRRGTAESIKPFSVLRWHHIESLLDGGETITVNFWYKVCKKRFTSNTSNLANSKTENENSYTVLCRAFVDFFSLGSADAQKDRVPAASSPESRHHEEHREDAWRGPGRSTRSRYTCFLLLLF